MTDAPEQNAPPEQKDATRPEQAGAPEQDRLCTVQIVRRGERPGDVVLLVDGHEMRNVAGYSLVHDAGDPFPVLTLRLLPDAIHVLQTYPAVVLRVLEAQAAERDDGEPVLALHGVRDDAAPLPPLPLRDVMFAPGEVAELAEAYLNIPPRDRWRMLSKMQLCSLNEEFAARANAAKGAALDSAAFERAITRKRTTEFAEAVRGYKREADVPPGDDAAGATSAP